jgi:integrase
LTLKTIPRKKISAITNINTFDTVLDKYIRNVRAMSKSTAYEYYLRLHNFEGFVSKEYGLTIDRILKKITDGSEDPYDILSNYIVYLQETYSISSVTLKQRVVTAKNFFEYSDIDISPRKFKLKVRLPKVVKQYKEALGKQDIIEILNVCSEIRLKTYVMLLAATGMRALEALSVRICDVEFEADPVKIFVRGEYTKTKTDRFVYLTNEAANQLKNWLQYKYRTRRVCHRDVKNDSTITEFRTPAKNNTDLIFSVYGSENPEWIYNNLNTEFGKTMDRDGKGYTSNKETKSNSRSKGRYRHRQITFHSFRRHVKTTISDLGYQDYSEWFISHSASTYWRKKESEKAEIFKKIEPYLTYLDYPTLERKGADVQAKVEYLEQENQTLRHSDQLKEDALAALSDQVMKLMVEVQELKRQK